MAPYSIFLFGALQRHVRTQLFCFILYYISISLILTLVTMIMKILWNERSQKKKFKKKNNYTVIYIVIVI